MLAFALYQGIRFGDPLAFVHAQRSWVENPQAASSWLATVHQPVKYHWRLGMVAMAAVVLFLTRAKFSTAFVTYGVVALALVVVSPNIIFVDRYVYGNVVACMALGAVLARNRYVASAVVAAFALYLVIFTARFAHGFWIA